MAGAYRWRLNLNRVGDDVVASVAAEHADGGANRYGGENAEPFHLGAALLTMAQDMILIRPPRGRICVARRHGFGPQDYDSLATELAPGGVRICGQYVHLMTSMYHLVNRRLTPGETRG